jgi:hypothetical protein
MKLLYMRLSKVILILSKTFRRNMMIRYICYFVLILSINLFLLYYVVIFCGIYEHTAVGWLISCFYCIVFKFAIAEFIGPLLGGFLRRNDRDGDR